MKGGNEVKNFANTDHVMKGSCSGSCKVSHEWLAILGENNRTIRNNAPSPKTITGATLWQQIELQANASAATLPLSNE